VEVGVSRCWMAHNLRCLQHIRISRVNTDLPLITSQDMNLSYLVLPNGTIKHVTQKDKDLWFGLRVSINSSIQVGDTNGLSSQGGLNNFVGHHFRFIVDVQLDG